jgi:DNA topoisomerase II
MSTKNMLKIDNKDKYSDAKSMSSIYKKEDPIKHVYKVPDTYIGSVDEIEENQWVLNQSNTKMEFKLIKYVPGLYNIFNEIRTNARDQYVILKQNNDKNRVTDIRMNIDKENGIISIQNNGKGIPVIEHLEHKMYIPTLIFGNLLTSTNYDQTNKTTGGKNGYGAKLTNIFSDEFTVETADPINKKMFKQTWQKNMSICNEPVITKITPGKAIDFGTKITFKPDYKRFGMDCLTDDTYELFKKSAYDLSACTDSTVNVYFNGEPIITKTFENYTNLYLGESTQRVFYNDPNGRWQICAAFNIDDEFNQISFANGINTSQGGRHVNHILKQIVTNIKEQITKKVKNAVNIKSSYIKEHLWLFVNSIIEDPSFSSQTKQELTTLESKFGSNCKLTNEFCTKLAKTGIIQAVQSLSEYKEKESLKKTDGDKKQSVRGIPKLDDANWAGGTRGHLCSLMLVEGDSARTFAVSGLSVIGRDQYGVFPLKGKLLNVREATIAQRKNNQEINSLKKILGLQEGKEYSDTKDLRYGNIIIICDADHDGSHIKGLLVNWLHYSWPSLLKLPNFVSFMKTPILKVSKGKTNQSFYSTIEYDNWKESTDNYLTYNVKYYKGLGTSTAVEAKEYFTKFDKHLINFDWDNDSDSNDSIQLAFDKNLSNMRKDWLMDFKSDEVTDFTDSVMEYKKFIHEELILFSWADTHRSIPSMIDGMKPSQRKTLFCALKKPLTKEMKVAQFAGYVSSESEYHHGEASLMGVLIAMAQNYIGSNNINVFKPNGQFGSRLMAGKDSASPRYIYLELENITRKLYKKEDSELLEYNFEDGKKIEPMHYCPIIPMLLVNGSIGIGTGFSTTVYQYNPIDISNYIMNKIKNKENKDLIPWYSGFQGKILKTDENTFNCIGCYTVMKGSKLIVTELPIIGKEKATYEYKQFLNTKILESPKDKEYSKRYIKDFKNYSTDNVVRFEIQFAKGVLEEMLLDKESFLKELKLKKSFNTNNMHAFDSNNQIKKYNCVEKIVDDFYDYRKELYQKRLNHLLEVLENDIVRNSAQAKFINDVIEKNIIVFNRPEQDIINDLTKNKYPLYAEKQNDNPSYSYLLDISIRKMTKEQYNKLKEKIQNLEEDHETLKSKTNLDLWKEDLDEFIVEYKKMEKARNAILQKDIKKFKK